MSRGVFNSSNKTTEVFTFKTNSDSGTTFDPQIISNNSPTRRVHIDYGDGSTGYEAAPNFSHTYSDNGTIKDVKVYFGDFDNISALSLFGDNVYGTLDLTTPSFRNCYNFSLSNNSLLSGVTHGYNDADYISQQYYLYNCNITGNHDMSMFTNLGGDFRMNDNPNLTSVTHTGSSKVFNFYFLYNCDITGNHDLSMFPNLGGNFRMYNNSNLTGITHTYSPQVFTNYWVAGCDITGNHDLSMFPNLGGIFQMPTNPNLTSVTHTGSSQVFSNYLLYDCNITGNHDMSMFPNLGGNFIMGNNTNLTGITHTGSSQVFTNYQVSNCNITGNHDLSMFPNLGGFFSIYGNPNLTGITHTYSPLNFTGYYVYNCNIIGSFDLTMFPNLGGFFQMSNNPNLTSILHTGSTQTFSLYSIYSNNSLLESDISKLTGFGGRYRAENCNSLNNIKFPQTNGIFKNSLTLENSKAFYLRDCPNLGYVDFKPLSGATMDVNSTYGCSIDMRGNGKTTTDVNRTLVDFEFLATNNPSKWSGVTLDISSNSVPDTTSGGYNGISALSTLTGATYQWTITTD